MKVLIVIVVVLLMAVIDTLLTRRKYEQEAYRRGYTDGRLDEMKIHIGEEEDD